jgi:cell wall-associated NlpC family hydrolase
VVFSAAVFDLSKLPASVRALALASALLACAPLVQASPDDKGGDAVMGLLAERGLLSASDTDLVQSVRDRASDMVLAAMNFIGVPYRMGGTSESTGFDCSGFTRHIFEMSVGMVLPRRADEQANAAGLLKVQREELKPGDLVFFNTLRRSFSHVGIYVGDGKFIHSPRSGGKVRIEDMRIAYWSQRFNGARRAELARVDAGNLPAPR